MARFLSLVALFLPLSAFSAPQETLIKGKIVDKDNKGLPYVNVLLLNAADSVLVKGSSSDENGMYEFEGIAPGSYLVMGSFLGYQKMYSDTFQVTGNPNEITLTDIKLIEDAEMLNEAVIVAQKPFIERQIDKTVVNVENSIVAAGNTALEVLKKSPGVMVDKDGNISLKGKSGVMIMFDGKPTYLSAQDISAMLTAMPADQIEKIEIITQPSARYDAAGNAGIINIVMKRNQNLGLNASVNATAGSGWYMRAGGGFSANYRMEKWNFYTNYSYRNEQGAGWIDLTRNFKDSAGNFESQFIQDSRGKTVYNNHMAKVGIDFYPAKNHTIGVFANGNFYAGDDIGIADNIITNNTNEVMSTSTTDKGDKGHWNNMTMNLNYHWAIDTTGKDLMVNLDYGRFDNKSNQHYNTTFYDPNGLGVGPQELLRGYLPSIIDIYSGKIDYVHPVSKKLKLEFGGKSSYVKTDNDAQYFTTNAGIESLDSSRTNHFIYTENINAAYANALIELSKKWTTQIGVRAENTIAKGEQITIDSVFNRNYTNLFPFAVFRFIPNEKHEFAFAYSRRIDRPDYQSLNPFIYYLDPYTFQRGNTTLKPQYTNALEFSHTYLGFLTTSFNYSNTEGVITQVTYQIDSTRQTYVMNENVARLQNYTLSTVLPVPLGKRWMMMTYLVGFYNRYQGTISESNFDKGMVSYMVNSMNMFTFNKGWSAELSAFYMSKQVYGIFIMKPMSNVSLGIQKKILKDKGSIKLSVNDIFWGSKFRGSVNYLNMDINMTAYNDSRNFMFTFNYKFGNSKSNYQERDRGANEEMDRVGGK